MGGSFLPRASGSVVGDRVIFPLVLHVVPEHAQLVAVSTCLSRRVGLSAPEASSADEPLGAAVVPRCRSGADGCSAAASCWELAGAKGRYSRLRCGRFGPVGYPKCEQSVRLACCSCDVGSDVHGMGGGYQKIHVPTVEPWAPELALEPQQPLGIAAADRRRGGPI
jgi:hypothetical protein